MVRVPQQLSPELRFDALMNKLIQSSHFRLDPFEKINIQDIHFSSISLRMIQLVKPLQTEDNEMRSVPEFEIPSVLHLRPHPGSVTSIECSLDSLHFRTLTDQLTRESSERSFAVSFQKSMFAIKASGDLRVSRESHPEPCSVTIGPSQASLSGSKASLSIGNILTEVNHLTPHLVFATLHVLLQCTRGLVVAHTRAMALTPALDQEIASLVLKYSRQRPSIDPLSTIQPSFLIQSGKSDKLRKNGIFKFLVHLRNSLRSLEEDERRIVTESKPGQDPSAALQEIVAVVDAQYTGLGADDDSSTISYQSLLQELFPVQDTSDKTSPTALSALNVLTIHLHGVDFNLNHPKHRSQSSLSLRSLTTSVQNNTTALQPLVVGAARSRSNVSFKRRDVPDVRRTILSTSADDIAITLQPQILHFVHATLFSINHYSSLSPTRAITPSRDVRGAFGGLFDRFSSAFYVEIMLSARKFQLTVAAEKLRVTYRASRLTYASISLLNFSAIDRDAWSMSMNHSLTSEEVTLEALSAADGDKWSDSPVMASLTLESGRVNLVLSQDPRSRMAIRSVLGLDTMHLQVPRSALRLYHLAEELAMEYYTAFNRGSQSPITNSSPPAPGGSQYQLPCIQMQGSLGTFRVSLQVMHGTWVAWEIAQTIVFLTSPGSSSSASPTYTFGLQIGHHTLNIVSKSPHDGATPNAHIKLHLPTFTSRGSFDGVRLDGLVKVDFFRVTVKPSDWDTLLSVQQKSGQDVNDLAHIIEETRQKRPRSPKLEKPSQALKLTGALFMQGFCIGLDGLSSTLFLECDDIGGNLTDDGSLSWHIKLSDLSLSLASHKTPQTALDRNRRSAFVIIDLEARMGNKSDSSVGVNPHYLEMTVTKAHAVMQPSSIGELGDFVDQLQVGTISYLFVLFTHVFARRKSL